MPPEFELLQEICGTVSRETFRDLARFAELFLKWNKAINLASDASSQNIWSRHILDSAQLAKYVAGATRWVDLGSGGGFPGLIVSILHDDLHMNLVESNRKKAAFLQASVGHLNLSATVHSLRVDEAVAVVPIVDVVSARALADTNTLLAMSEPWLSQGARALFMKGRVYRHELKEVADGWRFDLIEHPSVTESASVILEFSNVTRRLR